MALQEAPRDHELLDLVRPLAEDEQRRVAVEPLDDVLLRVAVAAVDAHRLQRALLPPISVAKSFAMPASRSARSPSALRRAASSISSSAAPDLGAHLRELQLDLLLLGDRLAERLALLGVADRPASNAHVATPRRAGRHVHAAELDRRDELLEALPDALLASEHRVGGDAEAVEHQLGRLHALVAELLAAGGGTVRPGCSATPGSFSMTNAVMPRWRGRASGSVTASSMTMPARSPFVTHIFCPSMTHSSPSRRARVRIACTSEPACGSVIEYAARSVAGGHPREEPRALLLGAVASRSSTPP